MHWLRLSTLCFSVFISMGAIADDLYTGYGINATLGWDDNYRLSEDDQVDTMSTSLGVYGELRGGSELTKFIGGVSASGSTYSDSSIDNTETYGLYMSGTHRGERWSGSLPMSYHLEPTTETELLDTGETDVDGERKTLNIAPGVSYQLTERNSVYTSFSFTDVSYDTVSLTEYTNNALSVGWVNSVTETSEASINGSYSEYNPDSGDTTRVTRIFVGYDFSSSEATWYALELGYAERESPDETTSDGSSSFQMGHSIDERNDFSLFAGRGYVASGAGEVRYQTEMNLSWGHALAERWQFNLSSEGVSSSEEGSSSSSEGISSDDRDYIQVRAGVYHILTREIRLGANYRYRIQYSDTDDADSNSVFFTLSYSPVALWSY